MKIDFRTLANSDIRNLTPYQPGKPIETLERELGIHSSIKLASNENLFGASPLVISAIHEISSKTHFYPDSDCYELKQALARFHSVAPNQLTVGNGSENILELVVKTFLQKGDSAIISQYAFITIPNLIQSYGVQAKVVPAREWGHDIEEMIHAIDEKTRVLFLVNPNNPTGTYTPDADFHKLMEAIPPQMIVVVDEAYAEYITSVDYPNSLKYLATYPNLIITRTFSKAYGLAALRIGYAISSQEIAEVLNQARLPFNVNMIAANAACVALQDQMHLQKSLQFNREGLAQMAEELQRLRLAFIPSLGNFMTMDVGTKAEDIYQKLLYEGVIVRPLSAYGMPRHIRVTIGTAEQNDRFLVAMKKVM